MSDDETPGVDPEQDWKLLTDVVYANSLMLHAAAFDVVLRFGLVDLSTAGDVSSPTSVNEVARVHMSWGHLKAMVPLLAKTVANYESQFGEVPAPGFDDMWKA